MRSRKKHCCPCQRLTWNQSTLAASQQGRMGDPPLQLLKRVLLVSANFPWLVFPGWTTRSESKNSSAFPRWELAWQHLLCGLRSGQMPTEAPHMQSPRNVAAPGVYTLWAWEGYRQTDPSTWRCHQSHREEQPSSGVFSLALLTKVIAICQASD